MGVQGAILLVVPEVGGMRRSPPPPSAKKSFVLYGERLVAVFDVGVAGAAACLGFKSVSAVSLVSLYSLSAREGSANLSVPTVTLTSCKCKRKQ